MCAGIAACMVLTSVRGLTYHKNLSLFSTRHEEESLQLPPNALGSIEGLC